MMLITKRLFVPSLLPLFILSGCAGNIGAGLPLGAALSSCSIGANADHMVPDNLVIPNSGWRYHIKDVSVSGPVKSTIPPPIMASTYRHALEYALKQTGLSEPNALQHEQDYSLEAEIVSQNRHGTFKSTTLELVVSFSLISQYNPDKIIWHETITTTGEINDWRIDACKRLRNLQEELAKQSIRQLLNSLLMPNK